MKILKIILLLIFTLSIGGYIYLQSMTPSLDKDWAIDQQILAKIEFQDDWVFIKNIRNFEYSSTSEYIESYYDSTYKIDEINSVDYIIEPFWEIDGFAHTMLSFWFSDWRYLVVSAEIRKEVGESFHPVSGLLNKYEIVYIIGDEKDLIKLRANYRKDTVIMYPIKIQQHKIQELFISVIKRADTLSKNPEFYNTLTNTCSTSVLRHVNDVRAMNSKNIISWSKQILLPSHSDEIAYNLGLINTNLSLEDAREYYTINALSEKYWEDINYSKAIRKTIK